MATVKLTKRTVDALEPDPAGGRYIVWDTNPGGFGVRVAPRSTPGAPARKVFVLRYRPRGSRQTRLFKIGVFGATTVDDARNAAKTKLEEIKQGKDPLAVLKAERIAPTVAELMPRYLDEVKAKRKPSTHKEYNRQFEKRIIPALGKLKVANVVRSDVSRLFRSMRKTPYHANRVLATLSAFFAFAELEGERPDNTNPAHGIKKYDEQPRERFLTREEWGRLGEALRRAETEGLPPAPGKLKKYVTGPTAKHRIKSAGAPIPADPFAIAAIRLLAATGCRRGEILSLRWDAVDFERGYLRLAATKTGKSTRPLSAPAAAILSALPREEGSPYVLPSHAGRAAAPHLVDIARLWAAVCHAAELEHVRLHDLRHSYASVSAMGGDSMLVIRSLLGHANISTTQRYAHLSDDPVKAAADRTAGEIAAMLEGTERPVTPLRRA